MKAFTALVMASLGVAEGSGLYGTGVGSVSGSMCFPPVVGCEVSVEALLDEGERGGD